MTLNIGSESADSGMSREIYREMDRLLSPPLQKAVNDAEDEEVKAKAKEALTEARKVWKKLAFAIANGVIGHILTNMEIHSVETSGNVRTSIGGNTELFEGIEDHNHEIDLSGEEDNVKFTQSNDGTGHVS